MGESGLRAPARGAVEESGELYAEALDVVGRSGDDEVADDPGVDEPGRCPPQEASASYRDKCLGNIGSQTRAGARRSENGDRPTRSGPG